jgi:hypothetical protein
VQRIRKPDTFAQLVLERRVERLKRRRSITPVPSNRCSARWTVMGSAQDMAAAGRRVVHGGLRFTAPVVIDDAVLGRAERAARPGPPAQRPGAGCHRGHGRGHDAARSTSCDIRHDISCCDAREGGTLRDRARSGRPPWNPRYGFHGLAHRSMVDQYAAHSGRAAEDLRLITLQLGNGCSAAAVIGGRSVDTTMGLTPLEGLVMGTRAADVDPALVGFLSRREGISVDDIEDLLNHRSGLLGAPDRGAPSARRRRSTFSAISSCTSPSPTPTLSASSPSLAAPASSPSASCTRAGSAAEASSPAKRAARTRPKRGTCRRDRQDELQRGLGSNAAGLDAL